MKKLKNPLVSLLWESEESYREWRERLYTGDKGYIDDLNLKAVYEEIFRVGRFEERYGFEEVFLHPCAEASTVLFRQRIMRQLYRDDALCETALAFVSCVSEAQKNLERVSAIKDAIRKKTFALQARRDFLVKLETIQKETAERVREETALAEGSRRLAAYVSDDRTILEREELDDFLSALEQDVPRHLVLNKNAGQKCRDVVIDPEGKGEKDYTDKLMSGAEPFLGEYDFKIRVYQNTDISCLDKKIQNYIFNRRPELIHDLEALYEKYGEFEISRFVQAAGELVFYLSCIRFVREYERTGYFFCMPEFSASDFSVEDNSGEFRRRAMDVEVRDAYDMALGINMYRGGKECRVVPNDYGFSENRRFFILTGANQGGKTTFLRSVGLIQCMAQTGMFVPCRKARLCMVGQVHTHFGKEEERGAAVGRFEQELQRMGKILESLKDGDMVLLNETFTSTQRTAAVTLLKRLLLELDRRKCLGGLVTHFYEISDLLKKEGIFNLTTWPPEDGERNFRIREDEGCRYSYARDIAVKCGATYEKLMEKMMGKMG